MTRNLFWNVDTEFDFMRNDETFKGRLPVEGAREIEGNLEEMTTIAAEEVIKVVNTADMHRYGDAGIDDVNPDYVNTFPMHCEEGTQGAEYIPATKPENPYVIDCREPTYDPVKVQEARNIVLHKNKFDIYAGNPVADEVVDQINPERVFVYGVATNVCNDFAVMGNVARGREVYAVLDAMKELPHLPLEDTLNKWKEAGVKFIKTAEVRDYL